MSAYIEFVIIDNFVITIFIGTATYRFLRLKASKIRLLLCAVFGTIVAIFYPFITLNVYFLFVIKIILGIILSAILFIRKYDLLKGFSVFMLVTFVFGGLLFACGLMIFGSVYDALTKPISKIPIGIILGACLLLFAFIKKIFLRYNRLEDESSLNMNITIGICGKTIKAKGFLDTGNKLYDKITGLPVIIISAKILLSYLEDSQVALLLGGKAKELFKDNNAHYINYCALGNSSGKILVVTPDKFTFYYNDKLNILNDVVVGLSFCKLNYQAILHPSMLACI